MRKWAVLSLARMYICYGIFFRPLQTWDMLKNVDTSVTTKTSSRLAALEPCTYKKISQAWSTRYNFLVADYWYSIPHWATSHFDTSAKCALACCATAHPMPSHCSDGNGTFLQHQLMSHNRLCVVFLAPTQLRYRYTIVAWPSSAQQVGCLCLSSLLYKATN